jgi:hypothetical protein
MQERGSKSAVDGALVHHTRSQGKSIMSAGGKPSSRRGGGGHSNEEPVIIKQQGKDGPMLRDLEMSF